MQVLNTITISSGYVGRDRLGGASDGRFYKISFNLQKMVKVLLLVLKKKMKKSYS